MKHSSPPNQQNHSPNSLWRIISPSCDADLADVKAILFCNQNSFSENVFFRIHGHVRRFVVGVILAIALEDDVDIFSLLAINNGYTASLTSQLMYVSFQMDGHGMASLVMGLLLVMIQTMALIGTATTHHSMLSSTYNMI